MPSPHQLGYLGSAVSSCSGVHPTVFLYVQCYRWLSLLHYRIICARIVQPESEEIIPEIYKWEIDPRLRRLRLPDRRMSVIRISNASQ